LGKGSAWLIILALFAAPLLVAAAAVVPLDRLPPRLASVVANHRFDLAVGGLVGFGSLLVGFVLLLLLGRMTSGGP
jgi:hypothetical protein